MNSQGKKRIDPSFYLGSGGVVYGLIKVQRFLKKEREAQSSLPENERLTPLFDEDLIRDLVMQGIEHNKQIVDNDKQCVYENNSATFFMSAHVGLYTQIVEEVCLDPQIDLPALVSDIIQPFFKRTVSFPIFI